MNTGNSPVNALASVFSSGMATLSQFGESIARQLRTAAVSTGRSAGDWFGRISTFFIYNIFKLLYPILKLTFYLIFSFVMAHLVYFIVYKIFFPVDLIEEPLHFDYSSTPSPTARVRLSATEKQWEYLNGEMKPSPFICHRFFHVSSEYEISVSFRLATSDRNRDIGKCMVTLQMVDCSGDVVGHSHRVLRLPYKSRALSWLDVLFKWPLYISGALQESESVTLVMMNNYKEGSRVATPTEVVEVRLSRDGEVMDIEGAALSIVPLPKGIGYFLYFFPHSTFFAGVLFLFYFFCWFGIIINVFQMPWARRILAVFFDDDEEEDAVRGADWNRGGGGQAADRVRLPSPQRRPARGRLRFNPPARREPLESDGEGASDDSDDDGSSSGGFSTEAGPAPYGTPLITSELRRRRGGAVGGEEEVD